MYAIDVEPIPPRCRNNREVHLEYLKHFKESVATIHKIVEEARVERPLDSSLASACLYTKRSRELVEYAVAIGYKIPLCLACAKQVQPALYNGHEIIKSQDIPAIVHNSEDTLKIAEITKKKTNEKMKTPLWTHNKINIRPPDYSKENFLATFTP
nr:hypothetical protein [Tanacetum cinerariifolium]